jgi:transposase-like protein
VSIKDLSGHMDTKQGLAGRRRRRHSAEFKAKVVAECRQPGVSMAAVALANGLNANLLRSWVGKIHGAIDAGRAIEPSAKFIALPLETEAEPATPADIRIELRRGATTITVTWPTQAAGDCAAWLRDWLR